MIKFTKQYLENIFFIVVTFILSPYFYAVSFLDKFKLKKDLKILIIQTAKIGDLICSTPVFREVKKKYPNSYLAVLVLSLTKGVIENNPYIDEIIPIDHKKLYGINSKIELIKEIKRKKFNWSFSLLPEILSNIIPFWAGIPNRVATVSEYTTQGVKLLSIFNTCVLEYKRHTLALEHYLNILGFIGIKKTSQKKEIFIGLKEKKKSLRFLKKHGLKANDFLVGISVTAGNKLKEWSLEKFAQLADKLIEDHKAKVVFFGSDAEYDEIIKTQSMMKNKSINSSRKFSLSEVPDLFKYLGLFISVDTGSLYIANAMGIPVVDIVGPIDIYEQPPLGDKCEIVQKKMDCIPCSFVLPPARFCKEGHRRCIKEVSVNDVYIAVKKILNYVN